MEVTDQIIIDKLTVFRHNKIQLNTCRIKESWLKEHGLYDYLMNRFKSVKIYRKSYIGYIINYQTIYNYIVKHVVKKFLYYLAVFIWL